MDGTTAVLKEKLDQLLREAAEVSVALDRAEGTIVGVPHYSLIEARAHELGQRLSREIQTRQMGAIAAQAAETAKCPQCGTRCQLVRKKRELTSVDGTLTVEEPVGHCPNCRRGFFPPPGSLGSGRPRIDAVTGPADHGGRSRDAFLQAIRDRDERRR